MYFMAFVKIVSEVGDVNMINYELDEINKASERFEGLSDAAEKSADRATKTPHVDD